MNQVWDAIYGPGFEEHTKASADAHADMDRAFERLFKAGVQLVGATREVVRESKSLLSSVRQVRATNKTLFQAVTAAQPEVWGWRAFLRRRGAALPPDWGLQAQV